MTKYYKCDVCGQEHSMTEENLKFNLRHYGVELPIDDCWEDDGGKLKEIKNE